MPFTKLVPVNTTVVTQMDGQALIGRIVGHCIDEETLEPLNCVDVPHDSGAHHLFVPSAELELAKYDKALWAKNCWTPPDE